MKTAIFPEPLQFQNAGTKNESRLIRLTERFVAITTKGHLVVPKGFVSDGASIPKFAWSIVGHPYAGYLEAAIIHDYLYSKESAHLGISRKEADKILKELMWNLGYGGAKCAAFYTAVRLGGGRSFQK